MSYFARSSGRGAFGPEAIEALVWNSTYNWR
jgi:hypothetical protein